MSDLELIDRLVATYRILNHTVRQKPETVLNQGQPSVRSMVQELRNAELQFSQELKARISGQPVGFADSAEAAALQQDDSQETTAEIVAQFGTAREATLSLLRALPDEEWDVTGDFPRSIRTDVISVIDRDRKALEAMGQALGEPLAQTSPA